MRTASVRRAPRRSIEGEVKAPTVSTAGHASRATSPTGQPWLSARPAAIAAVKLAGPTAAMAVRPAWSTSARAASSARRSSAERAGSAPRSPGATPSAPVQPATARSSGASKGLRLSARRRDEASASSGLPGASRRAKACASAVKKAAPRAGSGEGEPHPERAAVDPRVHREARGHEARLDRRRQRRRQHRPEIGRHRGDEGGRRIPLARDQRQARARVEPPHLDPPHGALARGHERSRDRRARAPERRAPPHAASAVPIAASARRFARSLIDQSSKSAADRGAMWNPPK